MPSKIINTVFAVHNHQPIGNFEKVFAEAFQHAYKPFLEVIEKHPELVEKMKEMVKRGQLELLTGSYYEAILAIIPEADRVGQIKKLSDYIHKIFDYEPRGM